MTDREKAIVMAYTGVAMLKEDKIDIFYRYIEEKLGRPVYTHELLYLEDDIMAAAKDDFMKLCENDGNKIYLITSGTYSDFHVCAATTDRTRAMQLQKFMYMRYFNTETEIDTYIDGKIDSDTEEETADDKADLENLRPMYKVTIERNGRCRCGLHHYASNIDDEMPYGFRAGPSKNTFGFKIDDPDFMNSLSYKYCQSDEEKENLKWLFTAWVIADDEEHALKIAQDERAKLLAEKYLLNIDAIKELEAQTHE